MDKKRIRAKVSDLPCDSTSRWLTIPRRGPPQETVNAASEDPAPGSIRVSIAVAVRGGVQRAAFTLGLGTAFVARLGAPRSSRDRGARHADAEPDARTTRAARRVVARMRRLSSRQRELEMRPRRSSSSASSRSRRSHRRLPRSSATASYTSGVIARGETLAYALGQQGIPRKTVDQITRELRATTISAARSPATPTAWRRTPKARVVEFRYSTSPMEGFTLVLEGDRYVVHRDELKLVPREVRIAGLVTSTPARRREGARREPAARERLRRHLRLGHRLHPLRRGPATSSGSSTSGSTSRDEAGRESYLRPGPHPRRRATTARPGRHSAVYYESRAGQRRLLPPGRQLRAAPVPAGAACATRASARATRTARHHPILRITRPHQGIDYAAPKGTPIWAVADGRVIYRGCAGGFGNLVKIRHARGYVSYYGHLSRFARGHEGGQRACARSR